MTDTQILKLIAVGLLLAGALAAEEPAQKQNWERMKECAAQAEKVGGKHLQQSHYSPKYERCFSLATFDWSWGGSTQELRDAFEGAILATRIVDRNGSEVCDVEDHEVSCARFYGYLDERMSK